MESGSYLEVAWLVLASNMLSFTGRAQEHEV
jgi:hypothetical protein